MKIPDHGFLERNDLGKKPLWECRILRMDRVSLTLASVGKYSLRKQAEYERLLEIQMLDVRR